MTQKEIDSIIEKYLQGKATKEEIKYIEKLEQFAENKNRTFSNEKEKGDIKKAIFKNVQKSTLEKSRDRTWLRVAASIIILVSISIGTYYATLNNNTETLTVAYITKQTTWGQKLDVTLPDGSKIKLNSGSKIEFPERFSDSLRAVKLTGEAFFDVAHNPQKPFVIATGELTTKVLGTSFNVEAYQDNESVKVTLASGKVQLSNQSTKTIIKPSEQAVFNKQEKNIAVSKVDISKYVEWKDGILRFENSSLQEAALKLEKWFNVDMEFENEKTKRCTFTGTFQNENLQNILESITYVKQGISCQFVDNKIIIKGFCTN
jgi:ferric-dicitrate binding protein FerR (iron transport regulator)